MKTHYEYRHTQNSSTHLFFICLAIFAGVMTLPFWDRMLWEKIGFALYGAFFAFVAAVSARQTVMDCGDHLLVKNGPLPVFRKRLAYSQMIAVWSGCRPSLQKSDIMRAPLKVSASCLWGHDYVEITWHDGRTTRIGTDDPAGLEEFLNRRIMERK